MLVRAHRTLPFKYQGSGLRKFERAISQEIAANVPGHTVAADCDESRQIPAVFDHASVCDSPRQSTTAQTNPTSPTGNEDWVMEHKGNVRRGVVFSRQGRARSVACAVAQNRARVGQMFDARSCVKNNTGTAKKFERWASGNAFLTPLVLRG